MFGAQRRLVDIGGEDVETAGNDHVLAPVGVEHDLRPFEAACIIVEAAHRRAEFTKGRPGKAGGAERPHQKRQMRQIAPRGESLDERLHRLSFLM